MSNITGELIGGCDVPSHGRWETTMTAFEAPPTTSAPENTRAMTLRRRRGVAITALLMVIAAAALVSTDGPGLFPSDRSVLACGGGPPGLCPSPPGPSPPGPSSPAPNPSAPRPPGSNLLGSKPQSAVDTWL